MNTPKDDKQKESANELTPGSSATLASDEVLDVEKLWDVVGFFEKPFVKNEEYAHDKDESVYEGKILYSLDKIISRHEKFMPDLKDKLLALNKDGKINIETVDGEMRVDLKTHQRIMKSIEKRKKKERGR